MNARVSSANFAGCPGAADESDSFEMATPAKVQATPRSIWRRLSPLFTRKIGDDLSGLTVLIVFILTSSRSALMYQGEHCRNYSGARPVRAEELRICATFIGSVAARTIHGRFLS